MPSGFRLSKVPEPRPVSLPKRRSMHGRQKSFTGKEPLRVSTCRSMKSSREAYGLYDCNLATKWLSVKEKNNAVNIAFY